MPGFLENLAEFDGAGFVDCELLQAGLTSESPGWAVGEPDLQIVLPFLLFFHLPHQLAPSIATAVESGVFPGVLHGPRRAWSRDRYPTA